MNNKIIEHLLTRTNQNPRGDLDARILDWLEQNKDGVFAIEDIREAVSAAQASIYRAIYRLAALGEMPPHPAVLWASYRYWTDLFVLG